MLHILSKMKITLKLINETSRTKIAGIYFYTIIYMCSAIWRNMVFLVSNPIRNYIFVWKIVRKLIVNCHICCKMYPIFIARLCQNFLGVLMLHNTGFCNPAFCNNYSEKKLFIHLCMNFVFVFFFYICLCCLSCLTLWLEVAIKF